MSLGMPPLSEHLYPPYKIAALVKLLFHTGVPLPTALDGTGLNPAAVYNASCLTSIEQYLLVCRNALRLSQDRSLPFRLGHQLHLADYGVYGLLLLSCESVRDYFRNAVRYQSLATPTMSIDCIDDDMHALSVIVDENVRGLLGKPCRPTLARFAYPAPPHQKLYSEYLQCPCFFNWHQSEIRYPREILAQRPYLANPLTVTTLRSICDGMMADIAASLGFTGKVYRMLRHMPDAGASMKAVASSLKMTDRTLRRRLAEEGTSFSAISRHVKYSVATRHLKASDISIEQVAAFTGFSDPANFRRAFIRWTSMTPAQFRRMQLR
jgi:AraC-like DNA-binding protein